MTESPLVEKRYALFDSHIGVTAMKIFSPTLHALCLAVLVACLAATAFAQSNVRLPPELSQTSSLREVLAWLDQNSFGHARVGLNESGYSAWRDETTGATWEGVSSEKRVFAQGFKFVNLDSCIVTLRNDDAKLLRFDSKMPETMVGKTQTQYIAELYIPLNRMSDRKGKAPYRYTKDPEKARLLGTWRTEFTHKGFFSRETAQIAIFHPGQREMKGLRGGETLTFTFDSKEMSGTFNAAFRQAIRLCKKK